MFLLLFCSDLIRYTMMNLAERHQFILSRLQRDQYINVVDLCKELKVSSVTIRKDLKLLEDKSLLFRTHGGATVNNPYTVDLLMRKRNCNQLKKTK